MYDSARPKRVLQSKSISSRAYKKQTISVCCWIMKTSLLRDNDFDGDSIVTNDNGRLVMEEKHAILPSAKQMKSQMKIVHCASGSMVCSVDIASNVEIDHGHHRRRRQWQAQAVSHSFDVWPGAVEWRL